MKSRWQVVAWAVLAPVMAACAAQGRSCEPCAPPGLIEVNKLAAGATAVRVCLDGQCDGATPLGAGKMTISVDRAIYDASTVTLQVLAGSRMIASYTAQVNLRRPSGDCDCGELALLAPGPNGSLVRR